MVATAVLALPGCAGGNGDDAAAAGGTVTVLAAASLTDVLPEVARGFERDHPGVRVVTEFAGSSTLAARILAGTRADVFASASPVPMTQVTAAGLTAGAPVTFARNRLQLAVPADNPAGVTSLADLADPGLTVALCAPEVPCGAAAVDLLAAAGVRPSPDTLEQDVRAVLTKLSLDEVDAALVYRTDVLAAGGAVTGIEVDPAGVAANDYPVAVLTEAGDPARAETFVAYLRSDAGRQVLSAAGFEPVGP